MDKEGFDAIAFFDVGFWDAGLEVENCVTATTVSVTSLTS